MPRQIDGTRDSSEWHLLREHQHERLEQQREAAELANPTRLNQTHGGIGHAHFEETLMLEEIEVPQALDLRVVHGMFAGNSDIAKPGACNEVNGNFELPLSSIEVNTLDLPGSRDAEGGFE
jgi:hypothetical protein